jgi:hypothetical protein
MTGCDLALQACARDMVLRVASDLPPLLRELGG